MSPSCPAAAARACWPPTHARKPAWPLPRRAGQARSRLRDVLPDGSALGGPVDTTATVSAAEFGTALHIAASEDGVDAVIALVVRNSSADLTPALTAARLPVPIAAVVLDQPESVRLLHGDGAAPAVPAYASPEAAARALARAARYGSWRSRPAGTVPDIRDLRVADARSIVDSFLARMPGGGWLSAVEADDLLRCYGIPMVEFRRAESADAAVDAAAGLGGHVVIKADVPGLLHKTDAGAVELDLHGGHEVRGAMRRLQGKFGRTDDRRARRAHDHRRHRDHRRRRAGTGVRPRRGVRARRDRHRSAR